MRKLCPNYDREDALDTVLEVPIPEEVFAIATCPSRNGSKPRELTYTTTRSRFARTSSAATSLKNTELQLLLGVIGAPLVPLPMAPPNRSINYSLKQEPIEMSTAKYIVRQYVAATGGEKALGAIGSMYAIGKVTMSASDLIQGCDTGRGGSKKLSKSGKILARGAEMGGFLLWQKKPELWCLELVVSGCKISAGSDGKVAWRQTPWQPPHASRGPPRPLRRALQGLDPLATANLFSSATCIGEKTVNGEGCYVLRLDADASTLRSRNTTNVDVLRHTIWGLFSHRTGLLVHLEDSHLLRIKSISSSSLSSDYSIYWETTMESYIDDYRPIDGVLIAHAGRTFVSLFRFGDSPETQTKTRMEETWSIEEIEFNVRGLSKDCFLPPADLKRDVDGCEIMAPRPMQPMYQSQVTTKVVDRAPPNGGCVAWMGLTKVVAVEEWSSSSTSTHEEEEDEDDDDEVSTPYPLRTVPYDSVVHPL